jgi:RNA polymerase sigma-70 factor (ECF subfamily)
MGMEMYINIMNIKEEKALIKSVKNGDKECLSKLWDAINPKLYGYLINTLKDKSIADDILQATWLKAISKIEQFHYRGARFSAWLFAIARNECRLYWRENKQTSTAPLEENILPTEDKTLTAIDDKLAMEKIFKNLSVDEQELLQLRFIGQLNFKEIAGILAISVITARVRLYRIIKKARALA